MNCMQYGDSLAFVLSIFRNNTVKEANPNSCVREYDKSVTEKSILDYFERSKIELTDEAKNVAYQRAAYFFAEGKKVYDLVNWLLEVKSIGLDRYMFEASKTIPSNLGRPKDSKLFESKKKEIAKKLGLDPNDVVILVPNEPIV